MLVQKNVSTDAFLPCLKEANKIDKRKAGETDRSAVTAFFLTQDIPSQIMLVSFESRGLFLSSEAFFCVEAYLTVHHLIT